MADVVKLKPKRLKHVIRLDADDRGYSVRIWPPPSRPAPIWNAERYDDAKAKADELVLEMGLRLHDAIRPPFVEQLN